MAAATYEPTLSSTDVNKIWRKVQGPLQKGFEFLNEEWEMLDDLKEYDGDVSAREITVPVDLVEGAGVASIPEGGWEAVPSTPNLEELTLNWILLNKRFTASKTARFLSRRNAAAQITDQIKWQGKKAIEALAADFADRFYGFSTGVLATVQTAAAAATSHTIELTNGYGSTTITNDEFITRKFVVGDRIALIAGGALVTNGIGTITARNLTNGTISVDFNGSVALTVGDQIVKANSLENTTLAGTDYNRGLVGLLDMMTSTSLHNLSSSTVPNWSIAYSTTAAGRFTGIKLHRMKTEIGNYSKGRRGLTVLLSAGVERDMIDQYSQNVRYNDPLNLEIDGGIKSRGVTFRSTRRVPPGYVFAWTNGSIRKMTLINKPTGGVQWEDAKEMIDKSGYIFTMDFPVQLVVTNRKGLAYAANQTEL